MRTAFQITLALFVASLAVAAQAQTNYVCRGSNGTSYQSSRPCPPSVTYYGPSASQQQYQAPIPKIGEAPDSLKYMSPRCASLNDAIRTASARGLQYETVAQMRKDYSRECADSEREAHSKMYEDRKDQMQQRREAATAEKQERDRASMREQQCGESKRILLSKRARTDLTEGEKAELRRFEDNYRSRCG
ncbi:MAG: hypothetical protein V4757_20975 [Pseudomonadota bacterium]